MSKKQFCPAVTKDFIAAKSKLKVSSAYLKTLIHGFHNATGSEDWGLDNKEFMDFINKKMNVDTEVTVSDKATYNAMIEEYEAMQTYPDGTVGIRIDLNNKNVKKGIKAVIELFGEDNVSFVGIPSHEEGTDMVLVKYAKPVYRKGNKTETPKETKTSDAEVTLSTTGYKKGDPQKNKDTDYVFTENAQAAAASGRISNTSATDIYEDLDDDSVKLSVSDTNGTNQAGIRTDRKGNLTENAFGVVVKKYQQDKNGRFVAKSGQFEDTDEDFELFTRANTEMFDRLDASPNKKKVFPTQMGLGKAAMPKRFAEWLQSELNRRYGIVSTIKKNTNASYDGYGLSIDSVESKKEEKKESKTNSSRPINIWTSSNENKHLSNLANRPFSIEVFKGEGPIQFNSVEHAFQYIKFRLLSRYLGFDKSKSKFLLSDESLTGKEYKDNVSKYVAPGTKAKALKTKSGILVTEDTYESELKLINEHLEKLLNAKDGYTAKRLGGKNGGYVIAGNSGSTFLDTIWDYGESVSEDVMKAVIKASFEQNPEALRQLLDTGEATLTHKQADEKWKEEFPRILMEVRDELRNTETNPTKSTSTKATKSKFDTMKEAIEDFMDEVRERVRFNAKTHEYFIDGKKADISVTQFVHGEVDLGIWGTPSTAIGNTFDSVVRDFFSEEGLKESYPNLDKTQLNELKEDLKRLEKYFDRLYGVNKNGSKKYKVYTNDLLKVFGKYTVMDKKGKPVVKTIAGSMDMLVVKEDGRIDLYDMKTYRSEDRFNSNLKSTYPQQLSLYKNLLESMNPAFKDKIDNLGIIPAETWYWTPVSDMSEIGSRTAYYTEDNGQLTVDGHSFIQEVEGYKAPRIQMELLESSTLDEVQFKEEFEALDEEEKEQFKEEFGDKPMRKETVPQGNVEQTEEDKATEGLYNNPLISASEIRFLGDYVMRMVSQIITNLKTGTDTYGFDETLPGIDFTKMDRKEIIQTVGLGRIFKFVKENIINPEGRNDLDFDTADKLQIAYDNFSALIRGSYARLITLEGVTVVDARPDEITRDDIDDATMDENDSASIEEKEREYWQMEVRNISARSSLSNEIRRTFENLMVVDSEGNFVLDKFGFGFQTFVDSGMAINSILEWVNKCTTIEEMEDELSNMAEANPWLNPILDAIKEEPFRSKFFQNFRKDFTTYSIITVEYDEKGNRKYVSTLINTKGAYQSILDNARNMFLTGSLKNIIIPIKGDIEGRGRVNRNKVREYKEIVSNLAETFYKSRKKDKQQWITENVATVADLLNNLGIVVNSSALYSAFMSDVKKAQKSTAYKTLSFLGYIYDTILDNASNTQYNPMLKEDGSIYTNVGNILTMLSKHIQDSIESSTFENGKMHYSFTIPSYLGKTILNLKDAIGDREKFENYMEEEFKSYKFFYDQETETWNNEWLRLLNLDNGKYREGLEHKVQLSFDKTPYNELSELSYTLSLMHEFFYDKTKNWAWYRVPILANKPSSEFIKFKRYTGAKYQDKIKKGLRMVADQELMRMKTVLERSVNDDVELIGTKGKVCFDIKPDLLTKELKRKIVKGTLNFNDVIKNGKYIFADSGAEFKFLPAINRELTGKTELGQLILDKLNGKKVNEARFESLLDDAIDTAMDEIVAREKATWESIGLFDKVTKTVTKKGKKEEVSTYKYIQQLGKSEEEIDAMLTEYIWNDLFATINIIQLTGTDLAYYKNVEDFQKRWSQVHAPSMKMNISAKDSKGRLYSTDGMCRTMYLKDLKVKSELIPKLKKIFDRKIAKLKGKEKEDMKIMRGLIVSAFEDINVADAQGYSSPTSYRKKMGMLGNWTDEMEEAYNRIISGDMNVNDLGILWQPLKPFVYTQTRKPSGAETLSELKVPIQNKNSEYVLVLADAIMRSGKEVNRLSAIFDFMEESAYDNDDYNGVGIDTIQFMSAVNVGSMGVIDINDLDSAEDIKKKLESYAYMNDDKSSDFENGNDRYNSQYVHTYSFEDYGIQQEVPAHLLDHEQLIGSQVRILSVSDITPGTVFNVYGKGEMNDKELLSEYFHLHAENIKDSFRALEKEFKLKGTRLEKNQAISKILEKAILKDQRYGADLLRACSLDKNGEFVIPLNDPIQSIRIQQLINSIIKSRINKQKIKGGPVVQASAFGFSDDLEIKLNDDGSTAYWECYMPIPSTEMEDALTKPDGTLMSVEEALKEGVINEEMLKAIGYRIPTEDKYSMAPLRIKGFVPKAAGEVIILPKEITGIAGSDFDIDKMYVMLKAFDVETSKPNKTLVNSMLSQYLRDKGVSEKNIKSFINGRKFTEDNAFVTIMKFEQGMMPRKPEGEDTDQTFKRVQELYKWWVLNKRKIRTKPKFTLVDNNTRDGRNNQIFDIQYAVLTHPDTTVKMFNPGSFDPQKKSARIVSIMKANPGKYTYGKLAAMSLEELTALSEGSVNRNIAHSTTQVYFHKQNMTAGKLIGVFANNNTSHAFLSMQDIRLNLGDNKFTFNGIEVTDTENNRLDNLMAHDGITYISKVIAGFLAASVDAVKDPVLNFLNLNTMTAGTAMLLARLGFDSDSIGLFLTQPILEKLSSEYFKRNNEGYVSIDTLVDEMLEKLKEDEGIDYEALNTKLFDVEFTKEDLAKGLSNSNSRFQAEVLLLFKRLSGIATDLNTLTFLTKFNSVTNAVGPTIADTLVMKERYNKFIDKMESDNPPFNDNAINVIENNEMLKAFYDTTVADDGASKLIFQDYFPHYTAKFTEVLGMLRQSIRGSLDSKIINSLISDYMYYKLTSSVLDGSYDNRAFMINDYIDKFSSESVNFVDNELIKIIKVISANKNCPVKTLEAKTGGYSIDVQEKVKDAWSNLLRNPESRHIAEDLFKYNIMRSGFIFSPKTFLHLASTDVKLGIEGYVDSLRQVDFMDNEVNIYDFLIQFLRNHSQNKKLVPEFQPSDKVTVNKKGSNITVNFNKKRHGMYSITVDESSENDKFAKVIVYKDDIYVKVEGSERPQSVRYVMSGSLGNQNNFLEYDINDGSLMPSAIGVSTQSREESDLNPEEDTEKDEPDVNKAGDTAMKKVFGEGRVVSDDMLEDDEDDDEAQIRREVKAAFKKQNKC